MDKIKKLNKKYPNVKWYSLILINIAIMIPLLFLLHENFNEQIDPDLIIKHSSSSTIGYTFESYIYVYNFKFDYIRNKMIYCILCLITIANNLVLVIKQSKHMGKMIQYSPIIVKLLLVLMFIGCDIYMIYLSFDAIITNTQYIHYYDMTYTYFAITIVALMISLIALTIVIMTRFSFKDVTKKVDENDSLNSKIEDTITE